MVAATAGGLTWQPMLGGGGAPVWADLRGIQRHVLSQGAWIDRLPGWLSGTEEVLSALVGEVPWRAESREMYDRVVDVPRLTAWYPTFRALPHPLLVEAGRRLTDHYTASGWEPFATAGLCLYRSGDDSVAWHGDRIGRGAAEDLLVAILSIGGERRLSLRPRGGGASLSFPMHDGDLLVMGGSCQRTYDHCVPKSRSAGSARISVQFRPEGIA